MGRIILCPKCQLLLREPSPNNPYVECSSCSIVFHEKHAIRPHQELVESRDYSEEGNRRRTSLPCYNTQDSFSKLLDESNKQSILRIRSLSSFEKNSPLYVKRDPPQHSQAQTSYMLHNLSTVSEKPNLYNPRFQENKLVSSSCCSNNSYTFAKEVEPNINKKRFDEVKTDVSIRIPDFKEQDEAPMRLRPPFLNPNEQLLAYYNRTNPLSSLKRREESDNNEIRRTTMASPIDWNGCETLHKMSSFQLGAIFQELALSKRLLTSIDQTTLINKRQYDVFGFPPRLLWQERPFMLPDEISPGRVREPNLKNLCQTPKSLDSSIASTGRQYEKHPQDRKTEICNRSGIPLDDDVIKVDENRRLQTLQAQRSEDLHDQIYYDSHQNKSFNRSRNEEQAKRPDMKTEYPFGDLPSTSGRQNSCKDKAYLNSYGEEVDIWYPEIEAFTVSLDLQPCGLFDTSERSVDSHHLWHPVSSDSKLRPSIVSNEIGPQIPATSEPQACTQKVSEVIFKQQLNDPQCLWLLKRLQMPLSAQNSRPCTEKTTASDLLESFQSVLCVSKALSVGGDGSELREQDEEVEVKEATNPSLRSLDKPLCVLCQHCSSVVAVPRGLVIPCNETIQKLRCEACCKNSVLCVLDAKSDQSVHNSEDVSTNDRGTSPDVLPSTNNLTEIQKNISLGAEIGSFALDRIDRQDCEESEEPMNGASFSRAPSSTSLPDIAINSTRQSGPCAGLISESDHHRESLKVTELTAALPFDNNGNALTGQGLQSDNEHTSEKEIHDKFQICTGLEARPSFNRKMSLSRSGSSSSDELVALSMLTKKMATSKQRLSNKATRNLFIHDSDNPNYEEILQQHIENPDFSFTKFSGALPFGSESPIWGSPTGDLYSQRSFAQVLQTKISKAHMERAAVRGLGKRLNLFLRIKKAKTKGSRRHAAFSRGVYVNGEAIPDHSVAKAEELAGPIRAGSYWYDIFAGFWGISSGRCLGITMPGIEEFDHPLSRECSGGGTSILVNGRELHKLDLRKLVQRGLPSTPKKAYKIFIDGRVFEEASGVERHSLGKLAPT